MPFCIVLFLSVDDALHQSGIPEQRNGQLAIETTIDPAREDLVDEIVNDAVQEVVPWEFKEQVLRQTKVRRSTRTRNENPYQERRQHRRIQEALLHPLTNGHFRIRAHVG